MSQTVGIVGGGKFGLSLSKLASENANVLLYSRREDLIDGINNESTFSTVQFNERVKATSDLEEVAEQCQLIFPVIASIHFRKVMQKLGPCLSPEHFVIHGTKGFDLKSEEFTAESDLSLDDIKTMSEVIKEESKVLRVGALTGPNLADEILQGLPTATVVASEFDEVIRKGREVLQGNAFFVFGSHDLKGAELAGALKNVIALASGIVAGHKLGKNVEAILITLGLQEMMSIGKAMGANPNSFMGTAGIGDLIATATSNMSRNYTCGLRIGHGENIEEIISDMEEVAEGVRSLKVANYLINKYNIQAPLTKAIYSMVFENREVLPTIASLMKFPFRMDINLE